ncbi:MAG: hypothetical protein WDN31_04580 [Hyphomicrobium sp.]
MRRSIPSVLLAVAALLLAHGVARADCKPDDFAAAVDKSGAALRAFNAEATPKMQEKLKQLRDKQGWSDADYEDKAIAIVRDERTTKLDADAEDLIVKIDQLGRPAESGPLDCSKLSELEAAGIELLAVMKAKSNLHARQARHSHRRQAIGGRQAASCSVDRAGAGRGRQAHHAAQAGSEVGGPEVGDAGRPRTRRTAPSPASRPWSPAQRSPSSRRCRPMSPLHHR